MKLGVRTVGDPFKLSLNIRAADKGRLHNRVAWSPPVEVRFQANAEGLVMPYAFSAGPDGKFATLGFGSWEARRPHGRFAMRSLTTVTSWPGRSANGGTPQGD